MENNIEEKSIILSFVLLNFNNVDYTIPCIRSIQETVTVLHEIIVVDNASTDDSIDKLSRIEGIKLINNTTNRGFCAGNNDGAKVAEGKYVVILNNDTNVYGSNINDLPGIMEKHDKYDVIGGKVIGMDGKTQASGGFEPTAIELFLQFTVLIYKYFKFPWVRRIDWSNDSVKEVDWASGCFFVMRLDTYIEMGGFDENIFIYIDEVEFHKRARSLGGRALIYPNIKINHYGQISWGGNNHYIGLRHNYNSATYFIRKHGSLFKKWLFIFSIKSVNLVYLPFFLLLKLVTFGKKQKINTKLKFCLTVLTA